ncbi:RasGEF [Physocladia obscura]|uniref:RasGEF n=1 Tax=Physocladia obscura TaxID=109957 RepID=A0AAD5SVU7_9FUNG|nr:RasGEF [Physocladia obscura]
MAAIEFGDERRDGLGEILQVFSDSIMQLGIPTNRLENESDIKSDNNSGSFKSSDEKNINNAGSGESISEIVPALVLAFTAAGSSLAHTTQLVAALSPCIDCPPLAPWQLTLFRDQTLEARRNFAKLKIDFANLCKDLVSKGGDAHADSSTTTMLEERTFRVGRLIFTLWDTFKLICKEKAANHAKIKLSYSVHEISVTEFFKDMQTIAKSFVRSSVLETSNVISSASRLMYMFDAMPDASLYDISNNIFLLDIALQELACAIVAVAASQTASTDIQKCVESILKILAEIQLVIRSEKFLQSKGRIETSKPEIKSPKIKPMDFVKLKNIMEPVPSIPTYSVTNKKNMKNSELSAEITDYCKAKFRINSNAVIYSTKNDGSRQLVAATIAELISQILPWNNDLEDLNLRKAVLQAYSTFISPLELLRFLIARFKSFVVFPNDIRDDNLIDLYSVQVMEPARRVLLTFLIELVQCDCSGFAKSNAPACYKLFSEFIEYCQVILVQPLELYLVQKLGNIIEGCLNSANLSAVPVVYSERIDSLKFSSGLNENTNKPVHILLFCTSPETIAEQLALIDAEIYIKITRSEFLHPERKENSKTINLQAFQQRFNFVVGLVSTAIINYETPKARAKMITHFIKVAQHSIAIMSILSAIAITSALTSSSIHRLKTTWKKVEPGTVESLNELSAIFSPKSNFSVMRAMILRAAAERRPCIPYLGFFSHDVIFIKESHDPELDGKVNLTRLIQLSRIVDLALGFQRYNNAGGGDATGYMEIKKDLGLREMLIVQKGLNITQSKQYAASLVIEGNPAKRPIAI